MTVEQIKEELQKRSNDDDLSSNILAYIKDLENEIKELNEQIYELMNEY